MPQRISSRNVFKPNARVSRAYRGRIIGRFRRCGPNSWDDYEYRVKDDGELEVLPGLRVQVEAEGPRVRLRHRGEVVVVEWLPGDREQADGTLSERRTRFMKAHLGAERSRPGQGAAAAIARLLRT